MSYKTKLHDSNKVINKMVTEMLIFDVGLESNFFYRMQIFDVLLVISNFLIKVIHG
jgi:hypothetical protein